MCNRGAAVVRSDDCDVATPWRTFEGLSSLRLGKCSEGVRCHRCSVYRNAVDSSPNWAFVDLA
jgi:hypothetical protein